MCHDYKSNLVGALIDFLKLYLLWEASTMSSALFGLILFLSGVWILSGIKSISGRLSG